METDRNLQAPGLEFPLELELMAFGLTGEGFASRIEQLLINAGAVRTAEAITTRQSKAGHYQSVHIPVRVQTRIELERLYGLLRADPEVKYCL
jgi:putative lipoic acid-binding regulatory protein